MTTIREATSLINIGKHVEKITSERDTYRELCDTLIEDMKNAIEYQKNGIGSIRFLQKSIKQAESILGENR